MTSLASCVRGDSNTDAASAVGTDTAALASVRLWPSEHLLTLGISPCRAVPDTECNSQAVRLTHGKTWAMNADQ